MFAKPAREAACEGRRADRAERDVERKVSTAPPNSFAPTSAILAGPFRLSHWRNYDARNCRRSFFAADLHLLNAMIEYRYDRVYSVVLAPGFISSMWRQASGLAVPRTFGDRRSSLMIRCHSKFCFCIPRP